MLLLPAGRCCALLLLLLQFLRIRNVLGNQSDLIHAGCAHVVHDILHRLVLGPRVGLDVDRLVGLVGQKIPHLFRELIGSCLNIAGAEEDSPLRVTAIRMASSLSAACMAVS